MLIVVVGQVLVINVVLFILFLMQIIVIHVGILVLHYALRGGSSYHGASCGAFSVTLYYVAGNAYWYLGAALSFKAYIIIYYIHGETT